MDPEDRNDDDDDNDGSPTAPSLEEIDDETFKDDEAIVTPGPGVQVPSIRPIVIMHGLISSECLFVLVSHFATTVFCLSLFL